MRLARHALAADPAALAAQFRQRLQTWKRSERFLPRSAATAFGLELESWPDEIERELQKVLMRRISSKLDVHEPITNGIPGGALVHMVSHVRTLKPDDVSRAVGVSLRTVQRRTNAPRSRLSQEQSGRTWKFDEILAKATDVFGDQTEAEKGSHGRRWLSTIAALRTCCPPQSALRWLNNCLVA